MKIPKTLKIGGHTYKIIYNERCKKDGVVDFGTHFSFFQKIWIAKDSHQEQQEATLIHEIIEAINSNNELKLEHSQISTLAEQLYQVLKDNDLLK